MMIRSFFIVPIFLSLVACGNPSPSGPSKERTFDSLAVLPFARENGGQPEERVRDALEAILPDALSKELVAKAPRGSLKVIATHVVRDRKLPVQPAQQSGKDLNVVAVLSGKLRGDGMLSVQLIAVESGELLWADTFTWIGPSIWIRDVDQSIIVSKVIEKLTGRQM